jgi:hypothetical protein
VLLLEAENGLIFVFLGDLVFDLLYKVHFLLWGRVGDYNKREIYELIDELRKK